KPGIDFNGDGNRDVVLCAMVDTTGTGIANVQECADPLVKDVFVELDFMENPDGSKSHRPDPLALLSVRQAFANAPVSNPSPLKPTGIGLHVQVDDPVVHTDLLALEPCTNPASSVQGAVDFDAIKATFFGTGSEKSK